MSPLQPSPPLKDIQIRKKNGSPFGVTTSPPIDVARRGRGQQPNTLCCADRGQSIPIMFCFVSQPETCWMVIITTTQAGAIPNLPRKPPPGLFSSLPTTIPTLQSFRKAVCIPAPSPSPSNTGNGWSFAMATTIAVGTSPQNSTNMVDGNQNNVCQYRAGLIVFLTPDSQKRLDPTSGVLHNFCSRACAKANSATIECEAPFSARFMIKR